MSCPSRSRSWWPRGHDLPRAARALPTSGIGRLYPRSIAELSASARRIEAIISSSRLCSTAHVWSTDPCARDRACPAARRPDDPRQTVVRAYPSASRAARGLVLRLARAPRSCGAVALPREQARGRRWPTLAQRTTTTRPRSDAPDARLAREAVLARATKHTRRRRIGVNISVRWRTLAPHPLSDPTASALMRMRMPVAERVGLSRFVRCDSERQRDPCARLLAEWTKRSGASDPLSRS
jgi:hypothetical protein